jgi:hypothetical protein
MLNARPSPAVAGGYLLGAIGGATVTAAVLLVLSGFASPLSDSASGILLLIAVALLAARSLGWISFPLPQNGRQIEREAFQRKPALAALRFAFQLGTSVRTYITTVAPYAAALLLVLGAPAGLAPAATAAALLALGFGSGRSTIVIGQVWRHTVIVEHSSLPRSAACYITLATVAVAGVQLLS